MHVFESKAKSIFTDLFIRKCGGALHGMHAVAL